MAQRGRQHDLGEALAQFGQRLEQASHAPNINRYKPMPEQDIFHKVQTRHRVVTGGNQSGKSYSSTADDVLTQLRRHPHRQHLYADRPLRGRVIATDFDRGIGQVVLPYWQQMLPPSALVNGAWEDSYSKAERMLTLADGGQVSFMSYEQDPDKFQGVWLDWLHFDEEPPVPIWREGQVRLLKTGGCWTVSMTPVQQMEWLQDEVIDPAEDGLLPDVTVVHLDTRKNIHLSPTAITELESNLTEEQKRVRFQGQYLSGSLVFPEFERKYPNVIPQQRVSRFRPELGWIIYESMDYGYANPTAWIWTAVNEDGSIVVFDMMYEDHVTIEEWARRVLAKRAEIREALDDPDWMPALTCGDPSIGAENNGQTGVTNQQSYASHGVGIATKGLTATRSGNQNIGLDRFHTYLRHRPYAAGPSRSTGEYGEPWLQVTENCTWLISEIRKARKPKQTLKQAEVKNNTEQIRDKDNHAIDAEKYLFMMLPDLRPPKFQTVEETEIPGVVRDQLRPAGVMPQTHDDAWRATISSDTRGRRASDDYSLLEGA